MVTACNGRRGRLLHCAGGRRQWIVQCLRLDGNESERYFNIAVCNIRTQHIRTHACIYTPRAYTTFWTFIFLLLSVRFCFLYLYKQTRGKFWCKKNSASKQQHAVWRNFVLFQLVCIDWEYFFICCCCTRLVWVHLLLIRVLVACQTIDFPVTVNLYGCVGPSTGMHLYNMLWQKCRNINEMLYAPNWQLFYFPDCRTLARARTHTCHTCATRQNWNYLTICVRPRNRFSCNDIHLERHTIWNECTRCSFCLLLASTEITNGFECRKNWNKKRKIY